MSAGIAPGGSLGGFAFAYNNGCGIYCSGPSQLSVISVSSVPEPLTLIGSAIALGFGITLKRRLTVSTSQPQEASDRSQKS